MKNMLQFGDEREIQRSESGMILEMRNSNFDEIILKSDFFNIVLLLEHRELKSNIDKDLTKQQKRESF